MAFVGNRDSFVFIGFNRCKTIKEGTTMKNCLIVLDVETGGLNYKKNPITQVAFEVIDPADLMYLDSYETFVKPYNNLEIETKALEASRVSMREIQNGIDYKLLTKNLIDKFKKANKSGKKSTRPIFVGHNFSFDIKFLEYLFDFSNLDIYEYIDGSYFDTLKLFQLYESGSLKKNENQKYNLTALTERYGIELRGAHGAMTDVKATKELFKKITAILRKGDSTTEAPKVKERKFRDTFYFEF